MLEMLYETSAAHVLFFLLSFPDIDIGIGDEDVSLTNLASVHVLARK
jgi:hypothetical protein